MSDIIPFPRSKDKLIREIKQSYNKHDFETMYNLFESLEAQFELDEQMALLKCAMLYKMEHYLELREEAIILLKQGISNYDDLIIYYVQSLNGLDQYFEVVEIINQIIDEVNDHKTRMELFPIKEYALSQIDKHNTRAAQMLQNFDALTLREQVNTILSLIDYSQYRYQETVMHLLNDGHLAPNVVSIMLEYLRFAECESTIHIHKFGFEVDVIPYQLEGLEHTTFKTDVIPNVLKNIEDDAAQLIEETLHLLNNHAILLYPINIENIATKDAWVEAYSNYFKSMVGLEILDETNHVITFIVSLDKEK